MVEWWACVERECVDVLHCSSTIYNIGLLREAHSSISAYIGLLQLVRVKVLEREVRSSPFPVLLAMNAFPTNGENSRLLMDRDRSFILAS